MDKKYRNPRWWKEAIAGRVRQAYGAVGFKPHVIDKAVEGEAFRFLIGSPTGRAWYGRPGAESSLEMRFVKGMLPTGRAVTIIECGGHHGKDTILLSRWAGPRGRVITFEPMADNVRIIRENMALNGITNVTVEQQAVGAAQQTARMRPISNSAVLPGDGAGLPVAMTTLDSFCAERGIAPDLVKIDVEGFELAVLEGAQGVLARHRPAIAVEVHCDLLERYGKAPEDIWRLVDRSRFACWVQPEDDQEPRPLQPGDRLRNRIHLFFRPLAA